MKFLIACTQFHSRLGDVDYNLSEIAAWSRRAAEEGASVVVFPEACLTGYCRPQQMIELAQPFAGELQERIAGIARDNKLLLTIGMPEKDGNAVYNSMIAVGPGGDLLARYRKTHLWAAESKWAQPSDEFVSFKTEQAHFGLMLCYDTRFPEVARTLALQGAEVLLVASAWRSSHAHEWRLCAQARAIDNGVYIAGCDAILEADHFECAGASIITGPNGMVLSHSRLRKEEMIIAEIDTKILNKRRDDLPLLQHRRPELYERLID